MWFKGLPGKVLEAKVVEFGRNIKKVGKDDPRRIIHSVKVGLAISLVSLFYYFDLLFDGFGASAMWAILTVVVVFEFYVGATLGRGLNRVMATFLAGALGLGAHYLANLAGDKVQPFLLALSVFLLAMTVTLVRFFPRVKERYDYGFLIFILTFCLVSMSGYRDDQIIEMAIKRVSTIFIGSFTALFISISIFPIWAGDDLHSLVSTDLQNLGSFLQGFGVEYSKVSHERVIKEANTQVYTTVLTSKQTEESLANFARREPGHGQFKFRHPWKQYRKIASLTRQCAYRVEALNGYLNTHDIETTRLETRQKIEETNVKMSREIGKAMKELALSMTTMTRPSVSVNTHIEESKNAANNLNYTMLKGDPNEGVIDLLDVASATTVASMLVDFICCTEKIAESVHELASLADFKGSQVKTSVATDERQLAPEATFQPSSGIIIGPRDHVITIDQTSSSNRDFLSR